MLEHADSRRYRILERLGEGGFGVVYRARLEGPDGFEKDVAIKLLRQDDFPDAVAARFRDEARILGLLRDRAIVAVDPPTRLEGRWALVMELVDGASCDHLVAHGPLPPTVALEIVGEVARALDVAYHFAGPDGTPLHLLHRDLKPANLRITTTGQVKVLDFGIARARFAARETETTAHLGGTPGYIAPERLQGQEEPAGDIYSLGVVLHELLTGQRPAPGADSNPTVDFTVADAGFEPSADPLAELGREMRSFGPQDRPSARQVEERCAALARDLSGPSLRDWAESGVSEAAALPPDERVGSVLTETLRPTRDTAVDPTATSPGMGIGLLVLTGVLVSVGLVAMVLYGLSGSTGGETTDPSAPPPLEISARQPFLDMVMEDNARVSERSVLRRPEAWDEVLYDQVVEKMRELEGDREAWQRMDQVWETWAEVVLAVREAGLPEVIAGVPWTESHYTPELQSRSCAKGLWQFMPETANRAEQFHSLTLRVADCRFSDDPTVSWTPTELAPPRSLPYVHDDACRIPERRGCALDDRTDVARSTAVALAMFAEAYGDRTLQDSGAVVQLTVASHNAGYDDSRFGVPRDINVLPAFLAWAPTAPEEAHPLFMGAQVVCRPTEDCEPVLTRSTSEVVPGVLAAHFVAVCYYATNYPGHPAFSRWVKYTDGYCRSLTIPTRADMARIVDETPGE